MMRDSYWYIESRNDLFIVGLLRQRVWNDGSFANLPRRVDNIPSNAALTMSSSVAKAFSVSESKVMLRIDSETVFTYSKSGGSVPGYLELDKHETVGKEKEKEMYRQ